MNALDRCWRLTVVLAVLAGNPLWAETLPKGAVRIADRPEKNFTSIQAAIDAAQAGATVLVGPGRFDERVKIGKPLKLVGAGPGKTVIGPTLKTREAAEKAFRDRIREKLEQAKTPAEQANLESFAIAEMVSLGAPVIAIDDVEQAELASLTVTSPGTAPDGNASTDLFSGIGLKHAGLKMSDCAVVGCLGDGVCVEGESDLDVDDCLVAGCWNTGIRVMSSGPARIRIVNSDLRNCYYAGIVSLAEPNSTNIEHCRISGAAWHGVSFGEGELTVVGCAIFDNARTGIYTDGGCQGEIKQNLFYRNAGAGVAGIWANRSRIEDNLFLENEQSGISLSGACEPTIHRNVFVGGKAGVQYAPVWMGKVYNPSAWQKANAEPTGKYRVDENLFWMVDSWIVRRIPGEQAGQDRIEPVGLPAEAGNRSADPGISLDAEGQIVLPADSPARLPDFDKTAAVSLKSRWPLTAEEKAMIPTGGTRDWRKWKTKPREIGGR